MRTGLAFLVVAYCLSQFFRAFLAVLSPVLGAELGTTTADLATASGLWFAVFALMQLPVGWALDTIGPRVTASALFVAGAVGGCIVFALAQGPTAIILAMGLIGMGCAPILMATYYIFARQFSAAVFGTLAGVTVGVSSLGNLASTAPLAWAVEAFGWRETVWTMAAFSLLIALGILTFVRNPEKPAGEAKGTFRELLGLKVLWPIYVGMFICYAPSAGLRGLWISPYITDRFSATLEQVGTATLVMGLAMVCGSFLYGSVERIFPSRKWALVAGNGAVVALCLSLFLLPPATMGLAVLVFALIGLLGASYPAMMSHGRSFMPPHLTGRGVSLMNLFGMGGAGVMQFASGPSYAGFVPRLGEEGAYAALFAGVAVIVFAGVGVFALARDK